MGIGKFFQGIFNTRALGKQTIRTQERIYEKQRELFPNRDPHFYLAQVWLSRQAVWGNDPNDPALQGLAFGQTYLFACVPPPSCARALGLHFLYKERPDILIKHQDLEDEYNQLMQPVIEAQQNGTIEQLYRMYNPRMADEMTSEE
jgi:hypothetical protein